MASQLSAKSDFTETFAIHVGLRAALRARQYDNNPAVKKAALALCKELESERSIYGRQLKMVKLMAKGVTIGQLGRSLRCSRRTAFRYLNYFEDAGVSISLDKGKYTVDKGVVRMLRV